MAIHVTSSAFKEGEMIPTRFTCEGANISPPLAWSGIPEGTQTLAIVCEDPDASRGIWTHWVLWNLPADTTGLSEHVPTRPTLDNGARQGMNDSRKTGYSGPCPPPGPPHRYIYIVYALDTELQLPESTTRRQLLDAMEGHMLAKGQIMGRFGR